MSAMDTHTPPAETNVHERIADLIRRDDRTQATWAALLGLTPQTMSARITGRTLWSLTEAMDVAALLEVSLDTLVGDDDLPAGVTLTGHGAARLTLARLGDGPGLEVVRGERYDLELLEGERL